MTEDNITLDAEWTADRAIDITMNPEGVDRLAIVGPDTIDVDVPSVNFGISHPEDYTVYHWYLDGKVLDGISVSHELIPSRLCPGIHVLTLIAADATGIMYSCSKAFMVTE